MHCVIQITINGAVKSCRYVGKDGGSCGWVEDGTVQSRPGDSEAGGNFSNWDVGGFEKRPDGLDLFGGELGWAAAFSTASTRRLLNRLLTQVKRILEINALRSVTKEVFEAARENLVIGQAQQLYAP